jgi:hypothetical protein
VLCFLQNNNITKFNKINILLLTSKVATLKYIKINNTIFVLEFFIYRQVRLFFLVSIELTN